MTIERENPKKQPLGAKDLRQHIAGKIKLKPFEYEHLADIYLDEQLLPADLAKELAELVFSGANHFYDALSLIRHKLKKPEISEDAAEEALLDVAIRAIQIAASGAEFTTTATGEKVRLNQEEAIKKGVDEVCANFHIDFTSANLLVSKGVEYHDYLHKFGEKHNAIQRRNKSAI